MRLTLVCRLDMGDLKDGARAIGSRDAPAAAPSASPSRRVRNSPRIASLVAREPLARSRAPPIRNARGVMWPPTQTPRPKNASRITHRLPEIPPKIAPNLPHRPLDPAFYNIPRTSDSAPLL